MKTVFVIFSPVMAAVLVWIGALVVMCMRTNWKEETIDLRELIAGLFNKISAVFKH